jgi:hypothetical protein
MGTILRDGVEVDVPDDYIVSSPVVVPLREKLRQAVMALPAATRAKYYPVVAQASTALDNNDTEVLGLLLDSVQTDTAEEAAALASIKALMEA